MSNAAITATPEIAQPQIRYRGFWAGAWRRFRRNRGAVLGLIYATIIIIVAVFAPLLAPYPFDKVNYAESMLKPSWQHLLGTDELGRDLLSRIMYGARPLLLVGVFTQLIGLMIGVPIGIVAGYAGGAFDWVVTRLVEFFSALPNYLIVLYLVMILKPNLTNLIIALSVSSWVHSCRLVRGITLTVRSHDYIEAARALGLPWYRILAFHILPQAASLLMWGFAAGIPSAALAEAGLSYLGLGVRPPDPSWGQMLSAGQAYMAWQPNMILVPGIMIIISILSFQMLADGIREAMDVNVNV